MRPPHNRLHRPPCAAAWGLQARVYGLQARVYGLKARVYGLQARVAGLHCLYCTPTASIACPAPSITNTEAAAGDVLLVLLVLFYCPAPSITNTEAAAGARS